MRARSGSVRSSRSPDTQPAGGLTSGQYGLRPKTYGTVFAPIVSQRTLSPYTLISP